MSMDRPSQDILSALQERAKELNCLYQIDELLYDDSRPRGEVLQLVVRALPQGWQFPESLAASLRIEDQRWVSRDEYSGQDYLRAPIVLDGTELGELTVCYVDEYPERDEGPFLKEERRLLNTIAIRLSQFLGHRNLRQAVQSYQTAVQSISSEHRREWGVILDFLDRTDPDLLRRITRKMINHLCWLGVDAARELLGELPGQSLDVEGENRPTSAAAARDLLRLTDPTFDIASEHLGENEILECIQRWIREDKTNFLATVLERRDSTIQEVVNALDRFQSMSLDEEELPESMRTMLRVALLQRFFTDQLDFVTMAKKSVHIRTFQELAHRIVASVDSRGKLGGKSAGLFLAMEIAEHQLNFTGIQAEIRCPKSYYLPSDTLTDFIHYNDLEDLYSRRYMKIEEVRSDYPRIISLFKNSLFPQEVVKGLSLLLDDLDSKPLIVRSSSLLEDRSGGGLLGQVQEPLPGQSRSQAPASRRTLGRCGRGACLDLWARPDRVSHRSRSARCPRRDGHHDPGSRRAAGRRLLLPGLLRRGVQPQRVPLVTARPLRRRPCFASCPGSALVPWIVSATTIRSCCP
jgi:pyruvate,water dikinase